MTLDTVAQTQRSLGFNTETRPKGDFYETPECAIRSLMIREQFGKDVWEPCCGRGAIAEVIKLYGYNVKATDLYDWGYGETGLNFLNQEENVDAVITNPPFNVPKNISFHFAEHALKQTKNKQGKVAFLLRLQWLEGKKRRVLFEDYPFSKLYVFSGRLPRMHRYDYEGEGSSSMVAFAWFVWDWKHSGQPVIEWI